MAYTPIDPLVLAALVSGQGTLASEDTATAMLNNQGTLATSANQLAQVSLQTTGNSIATVIMNAHGTEATATNQATQSQYLAQVMNNQGTIAKIEVWGTGSYHGSDFVRQVVEIDNGRLLVSNFDDKINLDAFSRLRVSAPAYRFDGQFTYQVNSDIWDTSSTGGSVTHNSTNRLVTLTANAGTNLTVLQGHYFAPYTPGRSQLAFISFCFKAAPAAGQTKKVGYFSESNGIYLEWDATNGVSVNIQSQTTNGNQRVAQTSWNIDPMDGTGLSGVTLDLTKIQIFFVSLQALYSGRVIVGFDIDGRLIPVHQFLHANRVTAPYIQVASQPIRYEVRGTNAAASSMDAICASVMSEGGEGLLDITGRAFSINSSTGTAVTSLNPLLSIRPKALFNSLRNHSLVVPLQLTGVAATNPALLQVWRNGTVSGPASTPYVDVDTTNSVCEYNANGTAITGGQLVYSAMVAKDGGGVFPLDTSALGRNIATYSFTLPVNAADQFTITATSLNASSTVTVGFNWKEIR